ncbi:MAG: hypothetical protein JRG83_03375, partial [Deltaproteobacteria bacterium]|nr:hypothetical protein [Deltaproteobacteria bacterium]
LGMSFFTLKYRDLDPALRSELRREWNRPVVWPAWVLGATAIALIVPGIRTFYRERQ